MMTAATYGEHMLARLEFRAARRRRVLLLLPATVVAIWAAVDLASARHGRLLTQDASLLRHAADHLALGAWTVVLVVGGMATALKPRRMPAAALVAIAAGPLMTPVVFGGGGGWHAWQIAAFLLLAIPALSPVRR